MAPCRECGFNHDCALTSKNADTVEASLGCHRIANDAACDGPIQHALQNPDNQESASNQRHGLKGYHIVHFAFR